MRELVPQQAQEMTGQSPRLRLGVMLEVELQEVCPRKSIKSS